MKSILKWIDHDVPRMMLAYSVEAKSLLSTKGARWVFLALLMFVSPQPLFFAHGICLDLLQVYSLAQNTGSITLLLSLWGLSSRRQQYTHSEQVRW